MLVLIRFLHTERLLPGFLLLRRRGSVPEYEGRRVFIGTCGLGDGGRVSEYNLDTYDATQPRVMYEALTTHNPQSAIVAVPSDISVDTDPKLRVL